MEKVLIAASFLFFGLFFGCHPEVELDSSECFHSGWKLLGYEVESTSDPRIRRLEGSTGLKESESIRASLGDTVIYGFRFRYSNLEETNEAANVFCERARSEGDLHETTGATVKHTYLVFHMPSLAEEAKNNLLQRYMDAMCRDKIENNWF